MSDAAAIAPDRIVIINDLTVAKGGATGLALASTLQFRERGLSVTFITGDAGENAALSAAGVQIVALGRERLLDAGPARALTDGLYNRAAAAMVASWIRQHDTPGTVYHLHGWAQILSPSVFTALRPVAKRMVLSAHDFFLVCPNGAYAFLKSGAVCTLKPMSAACLGADCDRRNYAHKLWRVARQAVRHAAMDMKAFQPQVLAIHEAMTPFLIRGGIPAANLQTVPNPVQPFLTERVLAEHNRDFLFLGRLEEGKGPDLAAAAAREAGVPLKIIGDGPMRAQLERDYPEVQFLGRLEWSDIVPVARQARALLMPSRYPEPYGLVAAEALWSGLPVIAADTAFLTQDIIAAQAGLSVQPRDIAGFALALRTLAGDDRLAASMSHNAFNHTRHIGLTVSDWIDRLLGVYQSRLNQIGRTFAP